MRYRGIAHLAHELAVRRPFDPLVAEIVRQLGIFKEVLHAEWGRMERRQITCDLRAMLRRLVSREWAT